jgi:ABC-type sugar transport system ATPase subunit
MPQGNCVEGPQLDAGSFTVSLPQKHSAALQNYAGKTVVVGVRPEDIHDKNLLPTNLGAHSEVRLQVDVVEPMGAISTLYLTSGQHTLIATVEAETTAREGGRHGCGFRYGKSTRLRQRNRTEDCVTYTANLPL